MPLVKCQYLGISAHVMHNVGAVLSPELAEREGSRSRHSWTEGWEEDRQARFSVLQTVAGEA